MISKFLNFETNLMTHSSAISKTFERLNDLLLFVLRIWIFNIFFFSGWLKSSSWETTIMLFEYEYSVPLFSPLVAAYLATISELVFPVLLIIGILPRFSALSIFVLNAVALYSYTDISPAGIQQHYLWGLMLIFLFIKGAGKYQLQSIFR